MANKSNAASGIGITLPRKVPTKAVADTSASATGKGDAIPRESLQSLNSSITALRARNDDIAAIRALDRQDGTLSAAIFSFVEVANNDFSVKAYDTTTHQFSEEGTQTARSVMASLDTLHDYSKGFADKRSIAGILETSLLEVITTGALAQELVLNKSRLPDRVNVIPYDTLSWVSRGDGTKYPQQESATGDQISLDLATMFISELHKHANKAYATTMMSASLSSTFHFGEFIEEMRRAVRRQGHGRLTFTLDSEKVVAAAPDDVKGDPEKLQVWLEQIRSTVEDEVKNLAPEDSIVSYDSCKVDLVKAEGEKADYVPLMNALSGQLATSLKISPSILGLRINGSQSLSNTESLVFLKVARGIQRPVEENLSRLMTLAVRLFGSDVYVRFRFAPINLRPEDELEAFKTMKQARILTLLSEGFISDSQAADMLGTGPRPEGAPPLSGTFFMRGQKGIDVDKVSPNSDPQGRALQSDQPNKAGGESQ